MKIVVSKQMQLFYTQFSVTLRLGFSPLNPQKASFNGSGPFLRRLVKA